VQINVDERTATDVSVDFEILRVDTVNEYDVTEARLLEISICTTGFGADQGAGLGRASRLGLYDAAYVLELLASIDSRIRGLVETMTRPADYDWGKTATDELAAAIGSELAALDASTREAFASLLTTKGE
jgi:hypothetical protein